jgi:hypothetical protein
MRRNTNLSLEKGGTSRTRYALNKEILGILADLVEAFPEQRFGQILTNYVFPNYREKDIFFEESLETLKTLKNLGK